MNRLPTRIALLAAFLFCIAGPINAQEPPPPGWLPYHRPTEDERYCANYSKLAWTVTLNSDKSGVSIAKYEDDRTYRRVIKVRDGRLVGDDNGEWGGGLWWVSKDGRRRTRLSRENVHGFVKTTNAVLIITGLRHMGANRGEVLRYVDSPGGKKRAPLLVDLGWAPFTFMQDSPDSLLVLTSDGFVRVHDSGRMETLYRRVYGMLYPDSVAITQAGVLYVGMRLFVTRLRPSEGTYKEEWFVPASCPQFTTGKLECVCSGAAASP